MVTALRTHWRFLGVGFGHPGEEQAERVLASMDTNEDGTISEDEFVHFMKQMKAAESLGSVASQ